MRGMIALIGTMVLTAASVTFLYPSTPQPTQIVIYDKVGGTDITDHVQHIVGHRIGPPTTVTPSLGALRALRDDPEARWSYHLNPDLSVHVFLIGIAAEPVSVSFQPTRTGHARVYEIDLEQELDTAAE